MARLPRTVQRCRRTSGILAVLAATLLAAGCASSRYDRLVSEDDVPILAALKIESSAVPNRAVRVPTVIGEGPVVHVAVHESGPPDADRALVLIHGLLSDYRIWRFVRGDLARDHRLLIVDLPGAGASDRPDPAAIGDAGYSPRAMAERILQALSRHLDSEEMPTHLTLVGHSLGGTVAIQMAGDAALREQYAGILDRVDRLVLFTPGDIELPEPPSLFVELATTSDVEYWLAGNLGILRERAAEGIATMFCHPAPGLREEADAVVEMLSDSATRAAQQAMMRQFTPMTDDRRIDWPRARALTRAYDNIGASTLIVWGEFDETLPVAMGYKLAAQIPGATLHLIGSCMHSAPLEQPRETIEIIREFSKTGAWPDDGAPSALE